MSRADDLSAELERIATQYARMLRAVGRGRGLGDTELDELVQEVRIRLWRALSSDATRTIQTSYVYQAAMSAAIDMIRRRRARHEEALDSTDGEEAFAVASDRGPETLFNAGELAERVELAVSELPEPRDVVVRLHLSGYHRTEIAELLGWSEPKVRNLLYRGLEDLRASLLARGIGPQRVA